MSSILFAWLYHYTNQSVLIVMLLHTGINGWAEVIPILPKVSGSLRPYTLAIVLFTIVSLVLVQRPARSHQPKQNS